jgi:starch synthase
VPIVRATGGLDDTVENFDPARGIGNGFKFRDYNAGALLEKIREALYFYSKPDEWRKIQLNGMAMDNSWEAAAQKYVQLYQEIIDLDRRQQTVNS